jgi:hypothetical protein
MRNCFSSLNCSSGGNISAVPTWASEKQGRHTLFVVVEILEEDEELVLIPPKYCFNLRRLLGVGHEHLIKIRSGSGGAGSGSAP